MKRKSSESDPERPTTSGVTGIPNQTASGTKMAHEKSQKRVGKRPGRKPSKIDQKAKLERSRQSARECRARKKLRYQYLEELVSSREKSVFSLRDEVEMYKRWSIDLDRGIIPDGLLKLLAQEEMQKPLAAQHSPQSHSSTPTASPSSSVDTEHMTFHSQSSRMHSGPAAAAAAAQRGQPVQLPGQVFQPQTEQSRRQVLMRQPNIQQGGQQLSSMNKGSRSFEESVRSTSSSAAAASIHRSGSVPNLAAVSTQQSTYPEPASATTLVYRDFSEDSSNTLKSTGFLPDLSVLSEVVSDVETSSNIPTVVSHHSPPSVRKPDSTWTWEQQQQQRPFSGVSEASQGRTYPFKCASSVMQISPSAQVTSQAFQGGVFSSRSTVSHVPNFLLSSVSGGTAPSPQVPFYQRPRSSSDLARKVTSSTLSPASSSSLSQQNLPGLFDPPVTTFATQDTYSTLAESVTTCLTNSSVLQDTAPVCMGSELSASISEPIPHWYSFLDDLESAATLSARQGAFSDAGTPGSSRARSGACTPSSVDSPYSQQLLQQQQQQQQQQQLPQDSGNDGNIPNIPDLLGQSQSS